MGDYREEARSLASALRGIMPYAFTGASVRDVDPTEQPQFIAVTDALALYDLVYKFDPRKVEETLLRGGG